MRALRTAGVLLFGVALAFGQQQINLTAGPGSAVLPDGSSVPMWGYTCGAPVSGSTATCAASNPKSAGWSPVVITVPTGQGLTINLTNNLSFTPTTGSTPNVIPTSLMIVGQLGGGLGKPTNAASPTHATQTGSTWPIAGGAATFTPPKQPDRVQSFGTEVAVGSPQSLTWLAMKPGTYLLESGTHPSIQAPMGLYGMVIVTKAPIAANAATSTAATAGTAYPGVTYDADIPLLMSEIDPVQNKAVDAAVRTAGFSETAVWSGQPDKCGNPSSSNYQTCYPPAVNYTPLHYLFNGVAFDKTNPTNSSFAATIGTPPATGGTGQLLVRFVNAGLRMHVPSIVGAQTKSPAVSGFSLLAEDGNLLPGVVSQGTVANPRVQSEVFMAAGKTYDVLINGPASGAPAIPVYDRELSLSGNANLRDAGMLAYLSVNSSLLPASAALGGAKANPDGYSVVPANPLVVSDVAKGLIANDINVYGVSVATQPTAGTVALNANGTFTYTPCTAYTSNPCSNWTGDSFTYQGNGSTAAALTAAVNLTTAPMEGSAGIKVNNITYTSTMATYLAIRNPGILSVDSDGGNYPLSVVTSKIAPANGNGVTGIGPCTTTAAPTPPCVNVDANGGFNAIVPNAGTYAFTYQAKNSQGTLSSSSATVTLVFPAGSGLHVNVIDGTDHQTLVKDYRWIIEEDQTFFIDPNCTTNTGIPTANCPLPAGTGATPALGVNFHTSHMPFVAQGCTGPLSCGGGQTVYDPGSKTHVPAVCDVGNGVCRPDIAGNGLTPVTPDQVTLDPTKRYYISVLPGDAGNPFANGNTMATCAAGSVNAPSATAASCGHTMGGAAIASLINNNSPLTIWVAPTPLPTGKLAVFVFEDDFPLNGEQDAGGGVDALSPNEPGLGGFQIHLWDAMGQSGDFTGQMTYDMFNQPLANSLAGTKDPTTGFDACPITKSADGITGMIVTCPEFEADHKTLSPLAGEAVIANLMPGRWGVIATPAADRIARGEEWLQTNTLDGQKAHDAFTKVAEPAYFQEYGPANFHVSVGFANPAIINGRRAAVCNGTDVNVTGLANECTYTVTGKVTTQRLSRTPDERLYSSGSHDGYYFSQCYISFGDPDGEDFAFTKCNNDGTFTLSNLPPGQWRLTVFDQWNDALVDGLSTPVGLGPNSGGSCLTKTSSANVCDMGEIATTQWQTNLYTRTYIDDNGDGVAQAKEAGIPLIPVAIRLRDGSLANNLLTDFTGTANFNETFPLFNWYTVESDVTRYKTTGTHVVYDAGGPADGTSACGANGYPACGKSTTYKYLANTNEAIPVPTSLRVPGSVYCADADCTSQNLTTNPSGGGPGGSTSRIDQPWVRVEGFQGFPGQNEFIEFGKTPYQPGENGGIQGHVVYASTRPFDDPQMLVQTQWEPLVPHVTINLYQEGTAADGTQSLKLVDTTQTSSFDDYAQGFHTDATGNKVPNMSCPGQTTKDPFYFSLEQQPNYLDYYNNQLHGSSTATARPDKSQFKCFDGMHNWNQVQPVPYDGMYKFPSIAAIDPSTGAISKTNCNICSTNPYDKTPMLPAGKYVVEVVVPSGFELVKEEDKNILIGDNFIAPVTQEFGFTLGASVFIMPDQAAVASSYNANNPQNPTTDLGASPINGLVPAFPVEPIWPCVGEARIVPDYISLFPGSLEVAPFAGSTRNLCDRKEVTLGDQMGTTAKFYIYTPTHIASKFTGVITDDFTSEFDPFSPQFGEKFAPPDLPVSVKDWTGNEVSRVYADHWGAYNGMLFSTWEVNPPNPTGYSPNMGVFCMNDPGPGKTPDALFNPGYSTFCYELPFMPGTTTYLDTPVVPTSAFSEGYNHPDCAYPDKTPAIKEVDGDGIGPWVKGGGNGAVTGVTVTAGGSNYTSAPKVAFAAAPKGGTTALGTAVLANGGSIASVTVGSGGSGYTSAPTVTFDAPPTGTAATGTAVVSGKVTGVNITNGGGGYCFTAAVTFSAPQMAGGTAALGLATVTGNCGSGKVTGIKMVTEGSGYTTAPTVTFSAFLGKGAAGNATVSQTVTGVTITNPGSGYTTAPNVTFTGGSGTGAAATTNLSQIVTAVNVTNGGSGYLVPPGISFTGGGGTGAMATTTVGTGSTLTITALGDVLVNNNAYSGPSAKAAPFNQKTVNRHYGFGTASGIVTIGGVDAPVMNWSDTKITVSVPTGIPNCAIQQQTQFGGSNAQCGELKITTATGQQSVDTVTVTVGGKAPSYVSTTIQTAIDIASPGDLIMVPPGVYNEMVIMWKPLRLQGVGASSSVINANTQPAGKLDPWRRQMACLFGIAINGTPISGTNVFDPNKAFTCSASMNFAVDRLPLEAVVGWDATLNGNLAELLQEPTLLGAYEGAGITILGKGVKFPSGANPYGSDTFPAGTQLLTAKDCTSGPNASNLYPGNFLCNPSRVDGLSVTDSSQGGGGIYVHAWNHQLEISNNRVYNNAGTLTGGITVGQGEFPPLYTVGGIANSIPGSCESAGLTGEAQPYCFNLNMSLHNNAVTQNSTLGDELFSSTLTGAGGVTICTGADYYKFDYNWVCGNVTSGEGGGVAHLGYIKNGEIANNSILFNQSTNPTVPTNGGGIMVMGAPDTDPICSPAPDADCPPGLSDGTGPGLVINANLIMGNSADSGSGGGIRLQGVNGTEVAAFPSKPNLWNNVKVTNNMIANNVAGWDGAGISLQDALDVDIVNNTIMSNDSTASAGPLFNTIGAPNASVAPPTGPTANANGTQSLPQPAGVVAIQNTAVLRVPLKGERVTCPTNHPNCTLFSNPYLANDILYGNRSFYIGVGGPNAGLTNQQNVVSLYNSFGSVLAGNQTSTGSCPTSSYWDIGVRGDTGPANHLKVRNTTLALSPSYSVITDYADYPGAGNIAGNPSSLVLKQYCNGSRTPPEFGGTGFQVPAGISDATVPNPIFSLIPAATVDEGNNWVDLSWGPLTMTDISGATLGDYAIGAGSPAIGQISRNGASAPNYAAAPTTDFYGNKRPATANGPIDIGATVYVANAPAIVSITPNAGVSGTTVAVTISGTNLNGTTSVTVSGGGVSVNHVKVLNKTTVTANFVISSSATPGAQGVSLVARGYTATGLSFTVTPPAVPALTSISPNTAARGTTMPVTLVGTHLTGGAVTVSGTGVTVTNANVVSPTQITATLNVANTATLGALNVNVVTPGGTSNSVTFTTTAPPAPTLTAGPTPASGVRGTTVTVVLKGTNLTGATVNPPAGVNGSVSNVNAAGTELTASLAILPTAQATTVGTISVTTGGGTSNTETFAITAPPAPTLSSMTPNSAAVGQNVTVTLNGTNFTTATSVNVTGSYINVSNYKVVNDTTITAVFQINPLAILESPRSVSVTTAGGTTGTLSFALKF